MITYRPPHPLEVLLYVEVKAKIMQLYAETPAGQQPPYRKINALTDILANAGLAPAPEGGFDAIVAIDERDIVEAAAPEFIEECNAALDRALRGAHEA